MKCLSWSEPEFKSFVCLTNSSGDIAMYRFWRFGLEIVYSRPFWGVVGACFPHMTSPIIVTPKRTFLGRKHVPFSVKISVTV